MHQFLATLFSLLLALCHHSSLSAHPVESAELSPTQTTSETGSSAMILPDRYQLAHFSAGEGGYAEGACLSCRRMDVSSSDR